jgi:hypothetical protein
VCYHSAIACALGVVGSFLCRRSVPRCCSIAEESNGHLYVCLSVAAASGIEFSYSMRLEGVIQGHVVVILIDSGSCHTFVSSKVTMQLPGGSSLNTPFAVQVASRSTLSYEGQIKRVEWFIQGYKFISDLKILPLQHFDVILGYNWLSQFSPMRVH